MEKIYLIVGIICIVFPLILGIPTYKYIKKNKDKEITIKVGEDSLILYAIMAGCMILFGGSMCWCSIIISIFT